MNKAKEHDVKFLESREDSTESFEAPGQPLDFVASPIHGPIVFPSGDSVLLGRDYGDKSQIQSELTRFVTRLCP